MVVEPNTVRIFADMELLFKYFGWYSTLLILGTCLLMIPINCLYKHIMKKSSLERLRKTLSAITVYLVACGIVALFTAITHNEITYSYLMCSSLSCGFLAQVLWAIIKFAKDYGVMPIVKVVGQSKQFAKTLEKLGINKKIVDVIQKQIDNIKITNEEYLQQEIEIAHKIRTQLSGFVEAEKLEEAVGLCINKVKSGVKIEEIK